MSSGDTGVQTHLNWVDVLFMLGLASLVGVYALGYIDLSKLPFEDAAILMRYPQHLASGHGFTWNVGEEPVDGATDFLLVLILALLLKAGLSVEAAVRLVGFAAHTATVAVIYVAVRRVRGSSRWMASISAARLAVGLGLQYVAAYFGTPLFALFAAVTWCLANGMVSCEGRTSHSVSCLFALSGLAMGLTRPEGVFLAVLMFLSVLCMRGIKTSRRIVIYFTGIFLVLGGSYFLWRWDYFGYPLPNPFYRKARGSLHFPVTSFRNVLSLSFPFALLFAVGLRSRKLARQAVFSLIPVVGFAGLWALLPSEMNFWARYQYAVLPIILISWPPLFKGIREDWITSRALGLKGRNLTTLALLGVSALLGILGYQPMREHSHLRDGRYDIGTMLSEYSHLNYTMATTEAGLLPLYSEWRAVDTWGLNDQWIAHHGQITESYLDEHKPELIMFHASFSPELPPRGEGEWFSMVMTLKDYAEKNGYSCAAVFGNAPDDTHYYYVRPGFSESSELMTRIQRMDYYWYLTGEKSIDYASPIGQAIGLAPLATNYHGGVALSSSGELGMYFAGKTTACYDIEQGTYTFRVRAQGQRGCDMWPILKLRADGQQIGAQEVASAATKVYEFPGVILSGEGPHTIGIEFVQPGNCNQPGQDVNLFIQGIYYERTGEAPPPTPTPVPSPTPYLGETLDLAPLAANYHGGVSLGKEGELAMWWAGRSSASYEIGPGAYTFRIQARGQRGCDLWPILKLYADGQEIGAEEVASAAAQVYEFPGVVLSGEGPHTIGVEFVQPGDCSEAGQDVNLFIESVYYEGSGQGGASMSTSSPMPTPGSRERPGLAVTGAVR